MNAEIATKMDRLLDQLSVEDQLDLVERLAQRLRLTLRPTTSEAEPTALLGLWRGAFPEDFDLDGALSEIRQGWQRRSDQNGR